jgi:hypothetical protein
MVVSAVPKLERFFRSVANVSVDKDDLLRAEDFLYEKLYAMLLIGQAHAKANLREVLEPWDLPITRGLQDRIHDYRTLGAEVDLDPILEHLARRPPLDVVLSEETEDRLAPVVGGLSVALARAFLIVDPRAVHVTAAHWDRVRQIFDLLL